MTQGLRYSRTKNPTTLKYEKKKKKRKKETHLFILLLRLRRARRLILSLLRFLLFLLLLLRTPTKHRENAVRRLGSSVLGRVCSRLSHRLVALRLGFSFIAGGGSGGFLGLGLSALRSVGGGVGLVLSDVGHGGWV